eukprot:3022035-Alexandrium_andersonii.AAC.1
MADEHHPSQRGGATQNRMKLARRAQADARRCNTVTPQCAVSTSQACWRKRVKPRTRCRGHA